MVLNNFEVPLKRSLFMKSILSLATLMALSFSSYAFAAASEITPDDCAKLNFAGTYKYDGGYEKHTVIIEQDGCLIKVVDHGSTENAMQGKKRNTSTFVWNFDISGQTDFQVPAGIVKANQSSDLGMRSLQSFRGNAKILKSEFEDPSIQVVNPPIQLVGHMNLPVGDTNRFDVDLKIETTMYFALTEKGEISEFEIGQMKTRVVAQHTLPAAIGNAFILGANYVLEFFDKTYFAGTVMPALVKLQRVSSQKTATK
jgi:hypothetical protein